MAQYLREAGRPQLCPIDISLDLAKGYRPLDRGPVLVIDRVKGVLPALVQQAVRGTPRILDEPVTIDVTLLVNPIERSDDVVPDLADDVDVSGPLVVLPRQH